MNGQEIKAAVSRARGCIMEHVRKTPLEYSPFLSRETGGEIYLKLENQQLTGSFKIRGAFNAVLDYRRRGIKTFVTASTGNHGSACAYAARELGLSCQVYMPQNATRTKVEYLTLLGAEIVLFGPDCLDAEKEALRVASKNDLPYLSPYNDPLVLAGQGTVGMEIMEQQKHLDAVIAPVGGGGLMSGVSGYVKSSSLSVEVIAAQPENSCVMYHSVQAGKILNMPSDDTLADGVAGGIEQGSITFLPCNNLIDRFILVSENEIRDAMNICIDKHFMLVEGSGALAIAALLRESKNFKGKKIALIVSGAKLSKDKLAKIIT